MYLRDYKETDANEIVSWIKDEKALRLWSADRYEKFPITAKDMNDNYNECKKLSEFYPMTLIENEEIIGHLILRNPDINKPEIIRLGFIIIKPDKRGKGYGKILIQEAIRYAKNNLKATEINLGVFENNQAAYYCYKSAGFKEKYIEKAVLTFKEEIWNCVEMIL